MTAAAPPPVPPRRPPPIPIEEAPPPPLVPPSREPEPLDYPALDPALLTQVTQAILAGKTNAEVGRQFGLDPAHVRQLRTKLAPPRPHLGAVITKITRVDSITQLDWYLNEDTGDDVNGNGATPATALRSWPELLKRWGPNPFVDGVHVVVHLLSDYDIGSCDLDIAIGGGGSLSIVGSVGLYGTQTFAVTDYTSPVDANGNPQGLPADAHAPILTGDNSVNWNSVYGGLIWHDGVNATQFDNGDDPATIRQKAWALGWLANNYHDGPARTWQMTVTSRPMGAWERPDPTAGMPLSVARMAMGFVDGGWSLGQCSSFKAGSIRVRAHDAKGGTLVFANLTIWNVDPQRLLAESLTEIEIWESKLQNLMVFEAGRIRLVNCYVDRGNSSSIEPLARVDVIGGVWAPIYMTVAGELHLMFGALACWNTSQRAGGRVFLGADEFYSMRDTSLYPVDPTIGLLFGNGGTPVFTVEPNSTLTITDAGWQYGSAPMRLIGNGSIYIGGGKWTANLTSSGQWSAWDPSRGVHTPARQLTPAAFDAAVADGGFGGSAVNPVTGARITRAYGLFAAGRVGAVHLDTTDANPVDVDEILNEPGQLNGTLIDCEATVLAREEGTDAYYRARILTTFALNLDGTFTTIAAPAPLEVAGALAVTAAWVNYYDFAPSLRLTGLDGVTVHWDIRYELRKR